MSSLPVPKRGEIWLVDLKPVVGSEMDKTRPAVVVSSDSVGVLDVKLIVPLTGWQESFEDCLWQVKIEPDSLNHLDKTDSADTLHLRSVAVERFIKRKGRLAAGQMESIATAIAAVIDYE